jgi:hypothetical protein
LGKTRVHLQTIFFVFFFVVVSLHKFSLLLPSMEVSKRDGLHRRGEHYKTWTAHPSVGIQVIFLTFLDYLLLRSQRPLHVQGDAGHPG